MEPRKQGLSGGLEKAPVSSGEYNPGPMEFSTDHNRENSSEKQFESSGGQNEATQVVIPALPAPVLSAPATPATSTGLADDDVPTNASDDDLIEKEWVDKAKKIIATTKDDPYTREREISKLQIEYIRRRYGREIGDSGDQT